MNDRVLDYFYTSKEKREKTMEVWHDIVSAGPTGSGESAR